MSRLLLLAAVLVSYAASAQIPLVSRLARGPVLSPLPQDADPIDYWAGAFMDQGNNCARFTVDGRNWLPCTATVDDVASVRAYAEGLDLTLSGEVATVYAVASNAQSTANSASTTASAAQTTANDAQTASSANATAIAALQATVTGLSKRACGSASISGVSIPLLGISSTTTVAIAGAPVGTSCDVGLPSFLPLGAKPVAAVLTAGTASLRFEGNSALLSAIIAIPSGTYRVCCDL